MKGPLDFEQVVHQTGTMFANLQLDSLRVCPGRCAPLAAQGNAIVETSKEPAGNFIHALLHPTAHHYFLETKLGFSAQADCICLKSA